MRNCCFKIGENKTDLPLIKNILTPLDKSTRSTGLKAESPEKNVVTQKKIVGSITTALVISNDE